MKVCVAYANCNECKKAVETKEDWGRALVVSSAVRSIRGVKVQSHKRKLARPMKYATILQEVYLHPEVSY